LVEVGIDRWSSHSGQANAGADDWLDSRPAHAVELLRALGDGEHRTGLAEHFERDHRPTR
jgi:hypothetical protein